MYMYIYIERESVCVYQVLGKQLHLFLTTVYVLGILSVNLHVGTKLTVEPITANCQLEE